MEAAIMSKQERRLLGRYDTPRSLANAVCEWVIQKGTDRVLEPSCGGGILVQGIFERLNRLGTEKIPKGQVWACDIDPRALFQTESAIDEELDLIESNFLTTSIADFGGKRFDAIVANPPYVKLHFMDKDSRRVAKTVVANADQLSARASLWAYFPIHAYSLIKPGGRMAWILPETILHSNYGREILDWVAERFEECVAASIRERCFVSEGAKERVVILLLAGAGKPAKRGVELVEFATADGFTQFVESNRHTSGRALPRLNGHAVPHLISSSAAKLIDSLQNSPDLVPLGTLADIRIGVVTGNNKFFVLSETARKERGLRKNHFQRVLSKFSDTAEDIQIDIEKLNEESIRSWLLCPKPTSKDKNLTSYLDKYKREDVETNSTMGRRSHWQCPELGKIPHAFLRYMGKFAPRMVLNRGLFYCTNTIHRVFFKEEVPRSDWLSICLLAHSTYSQLSAEIEGRQYGSGVLKVEPSEAARLLIPYSENLVQAVAEFWNMYYTRLDRTDLEIVVNEIDCLISRELPELAEAIPINRAKKVLYAAKSRRNSFYLSTES